MIFGLAPMDGITDCIFRTITQEIFLKYNKNPKHQLWTWTEFMNADGYMINPQRLVKHLVHHEKEQNLIAQIYGGNLDTLVKTAIDIESKYPHFAGIELNIGCPSPKVMSCGAGSGMLRDKKNCLEIIKSISTSISKPFSIKTRAGLSLDDKPEQFEFLLDASKYCSMITVHGRTFGQGHSGGVDRDMISRLKKAVGDSCTVLGNGGITSYQEQLDLVDSYAIDGTMVGQSAIANPWIFIDYEPSAEDRYEVIMRHMNLLMAYELYFNEHIGPEYHNKQIVLNRRAAHAEKNDDVAGKNLEAIDFHDYLFPMPTFAHLEEISRNLQNYDLTPLRSCIEFRKYLFNYVKGLVGNKEFKMEIAQIRDYEGMKVEVEKFFGK